MNVRCTYRFLMTPSPYGIPEASAYPSAAGAAVKAGVRPGQVDELEQAQRGPGRLGEPEGSEAPVVDGHQLSWGHVSHVLRPDDVQGSGLGGHAPSAPFNPGGSLAV